jgi:hypothetical protein
MLDDYGAVRESPLKRFVELWTHPDYPPSRVQAGELEMVERTYSCVLPKSYKDEVLYAGLPHTAIWLLDAITDNDLDMHDISEFLSPDEIVQTTNDWHKMGLPRNLIAFAKGCMGNLFAFSRADQGESRVWFFDHDFGEAGEISDSFLGWLDDYCARVPRGTTELD